ncbi:DegT/DnrJ/EryC1/StrS family aminotransferase [Methylophaga sp.]|uniref:DegT/DnrJ/EryC1/StrS family aminotransferase n=1 Tax=Methylophaga sp. TaxID=2024840 RepID=UPI0013FEE41C|nr:DegT/DnrJ/EryC1/StrS family aminotransferase [Methylophaga sp.]MTI64676.1 aminotransferase class I/II-fold pyridoxal phosphate-dependent enzyme [Methylophaga sp.]
MKQIKSKADLAINGAPPAFAEKLHVGRPNIGDKAEFLKYVDQIFDSKWLSNNGPLVQQLENKIANIHDVKHCIAMCNGTVALEIAIRALELAGEVILPSYTFIATAHALHWQEITPVFADIDPDTHCLDPESVKKMITPKTTGIIGVHLWGHAAPVNELQQIADEHNLKLMFDAAHAFGCSYQGRMIGNFGEAEVLSFHATKLFNTFEGGAVLTNNGELAEKMRLMRNFGFGGVDNVIYPGTNGKMVEIAAAMGLVNLDKLESVIQHNEKNYRAYQKGLDGLPGINLFLFDEAEKNNFQYVVIEVGENCPIRRDDLVEMLHAENVLARKYFWPGCHKMLPYRELYPHAGLLLSNTQTVADNVIVLPTGKAVSEQDVDLICHIVCKHIETAL